MTVRFMVADDEYWVRKGIISKKDWGSYGLELIGEACNGEETLRLIESRQPDIALVDIKMPLLDGLGVIKAVKQQNLKTRFIIISGYSDFEFAKEAIKFGVYDYILKPVDDETLAEILFNLKAEIETENLEKERVKKLEKDMCESDIIIRDGILNDLLFKEKSLSGDFHHFQGSEILFETGRYAIAIVLIDKENCFAENCFSENSFSENCFGEAEIREVREIISDIAAESLGFISFKSQKKDNEFIVICAMGKPAEEKVQFILNDIIAAVNTRCGRKVHIGYGPTVDGVGRLRISYLFALNALKRMILDGGRHKIYCHEERGMNNQVGSYISPDMEMLFEKYAKTATVKPISDCLNDIFDLLEKDAPKLSYITFEDICIRLFSVLEKVYGTLDQAHMSELQRKLDFYEIVESFNNLGDARRWFLKYIEAGFESAAIKRPPSGETIVLQIKDYIEKHYNEEISLTRISEMFYINPNYLSRIFKEKIGKGFNEYFISVRMKKAVELMRAKNIKVEDAANIVGYENQRYFTYVFKKYYGLTPTDYIRSQNVNNG